jgi:ATP-dependent RNA helicase DDX51/DBP6
MTQSDFVPEFLQHPITISSELKPSAESSIENPQLFLHSQLIHNLQKSNMNHLFPVQMAVIQHLLKDLDCDLCVSAATGSGKTLGYLLPILNRLIERQVIRIRALIILPTRDLAFQVKSTMDTFIQGSGLKCALLTGQSSFQQEQGLLVDVEDMSHKVDIIIATPGRLLDHLNGTNGFHLRDLEFLVMDEADRLMNQTYNHWLDGIELHLNQPKNMAHLSWFIDDEDDQLNVFSLSQLKGPRLYKFLFSATLTRNPEKLNALKLNNPIYISVVAEEQDKFAVPPTLTESMVVCETLGRKPLALLYLLLNHKQEGVLIFTKSVESAHRLAILLQLFFSKWKEVYPDQSIPTVAAISAEIKVKERKKLLESYKNGKLNIIVSSDVLSRGIDLEENVNLVINYNVPNRLKTYIHRVGRTARAGRTGEAITLLDPKEARWFKEEMKQVIRPQEKVSKLNISESQFELLMKPYEEALEKLGDAVNGMPIEEESGTEDALNEQMIEDTIPESEPSFFTNQNVLMDLNASFNEIFQM